ncbi:MAG: 23S rRNA (pseudouridine1915-N3)-methyltransferase [Lysobacterales bacterium]|jgi:23S rRNA (pseudouridine1915-N3)-methyltransferase
MLIKVAAVGQKMPQWVTTAWQEYARRFPPGLRLNIAEIPMQRRGKNADIDRLRNLEGEALLGAVPKAAMTIAMDIYGKTWSTAELAKQFEDWMSAGRDICIFIGGPDGLSNDCLGAVEGKWSLGPLTLPHPLVRVVLAEQLYRAWSIVNNHPYHRE